MPCFIGCKETNQRKGSLITRRFSAVSLLAKSPVLLAKKQAPRKVATLTGCFAEKLSAFCFAARLRDMAFYPLV
jgi:hypothetical protein